MAFPSGFRAPAGALPRTAALSAAPVSVPVSERPWTRSLAAARANLLPGLVLQAFALALMLAYYFHAPTHRLLDVVADWKARLGWVYSLFATALFGGAVPFLYMRLHRGTRAFTPWSHGLFLILFWAFKGVEVDFFYRFQGWMFGREPGFATVAAKVLVDQFVYTPFWSSPFAVILFHWKEAGFGWRNLHVTQWPALLKRNLPPALFGTWGVWIPAVAIIYCLPATLQVPLFNIVLCFFSLLFSSIMRKKSAVRG